MFISFTIVRKFIFNHKEIQNLHPLGKVCWGRAGRGGEERERKYLLTQKKQVVNSGKGILDTEIHILAQTRSI